MADTHTHKMMRKVKTAMIERKRILHGEDLKNGKRCCGYGAIEMHDPTMMNLLYQWCAGPKRSGYQRKSEAKSKVINRRIDKSKLKEDFRKELNMEM